MIEGSLRMKDKGTSSFVEGTGIQEGDRPEETSIQENAMPCSSNSWIVDMEKMLEHTKPSEEMECWKKTSIYQVPEWLKELTNRKAFQPWLVSLGPFHNGKPDLQPMEEHKRRAMLHLVQRSGKPVKEFVTAIEEVVDTLQDAYQGLDKDKWRGDGKSHFVEVMVRDGCFLLEVMRVDTLMYKYNRIFKREDDDDYAFNDPVFSKRGLYCLYRAIRSDMVVLENQLPLLVLKRLKAVQDGETQSDKEINAQVSLFLGGQCDLKEMDKLALHPLDVLHRGHCSDSTQDGECYIRDDTGVATAVELREAGVHFDLRETTKLDDIDFKNGVLTLPFVYIDEGSEKLFLNLMVFEQLHLEAGSGVTNYLVFMNQIIDSERDVALLRDKGIIENLNDKEVADLFNIMNKGGTPNLSYKALRVKLDMWDYYKKRRNRWRAFFMHTYLKNPWVFISLLVAVIILIATLLQTTYTVVPFYTKS